MSIDQRYLIRFEYMRQGTVDELRSLYSVFHVREMRDVQHLARNAHRYVVYLWVTRHEWDILSRTWYGEHINPTHFVL